MSLRVRCYHHDDNEWIELATVFKEDKMICELKCTDIIHGIWLNVDNQHCRLHISKRNRSTGRHLVDCYFGFDELIVTHHVAGEKEVAPDLVKQEKLDI